MVLFFLSEAREKGKEECKAGMCLLACSWVISQMMAQANGLAVLEYPAGQAWVSMGQSSDAEARRSYRWFNQHLPNGCMFRVNQFRHMPTQSSLPVVLLIIFA